MPRGRQPDDGEARDEVITVRLKRVERETLDQTRGAKTRSAFVRQLIREAGSK